MNNITKLQTFEFVANGEVFDTRIGNWYTARCYAQHVSDETGVAVGFRDVEEPEHMSSAAWFTTESPQEAYKYYWGIQKMSVTPRDNGMQIEFEEKQNPRRYRAVNKCLTKQDDLYYISSWQPTRAKCLAQIKKEKKDGNT